MSETLDIGSFNDLFYLGLMTGLLLLAGLLSGVANFCIVASFHDTPGRSLPRELLIGVVAAITVPLFLTVLSSSLMGSTKLVLVDYLRLFALTVVYGLVVRRLFARGGAGTQVEPRSSDQLSLIDVDILRSIEDQAPAHDALPKLPSDLVISDSKLAERVRRLRESGHLGVRVSEDGQSEQFVTSVGWAAINRMVQHGSV